MIFDWQWTVGGWHALYDRFRVVFGIGMGLVGWLLAWLHLIIFDRFFLRKGSMKNYNAVR